MGSGPKQSEVQLENEVAYKKRETLYYGWCFGRKQKAYRIRTKPQMIPLYEDDCIGILPNDTYSNLFRWFDNRNTTGTVHFLFPLK